METGRPSPDFGIELISPLQLDISALSTDASFLSSVAIILGAIFVVYQLRQDDKALKASVRQANAASEQAKLTNEQMIQNNNLATMDMVMRIYEFANSLEVQSSYLTVLKTQISSFDDFQRLPDPQQLAFFQIASLFESLGFLVDKGFVKAEIVDDMFATRLAWDVLEPFILGVRKRYSAEDYYFFFERLKNRLAGNDTGSVTAGFLASRAKEKDAAS